MSSKPEEQANNLNAEALQWLDSVLSLVRNAKNRNLNTQKTLVMWASEWISEIEKLDEGIEDFSIHYMMAESYKEVNSSEMSVMNLLVEIFKAINHIRGNMYKIVNQNQCERLLMVKLSAEQRLVSLTVEHEKLSKKLDSRKDVLRRRNMERKWKTNQPRSALAEEEIRKKAFEEHKKFLANREAIESLKNSDSYSVISNDSDVENDTLLAESPNMTRRKQRRSRSLTRKVMGSVKKTIRRSVSALHNYIDGHHHDHQQ